MVYFDIQAIKCAIFGGLLLGVATSINYIIRGKVTGMSGTIFGIVSGNRSEMPQKLTLVGGMLLASSLAFKQYGYGRTQGFQPFGPKNQIASWTSEIGFCVAGFMVGFGTKLSNGCTSGHGLCGLPRLSPRSWVSVITFLLTAMAVSNIDYYFGLGPLSGGSNNVPMTTLDHEFTSNIALILSILFPIAGIIMEGGIFDKLIVYIVGALFAGGLMISGMSRRVNIIHFLQINSSWNPALLFVLGCGLILNFVTFNIMRKRGKSLTGNPVFDPKNNSIDWKLIFGSFCFGIGWGIGGMCPGPFLVLLTVPTLQTALYWGISSVIGMYVAQGLSSVLQYQFKKSAKDIKAA